MSDAEFVHWVKAGDPSAARRHRLTVLAECGVTYVPHRQGARSSLPSCSACEATNGAIARGKGGSASDASVHFVYRCFDAEGRLLYVGCTVDPKSRAIQHQATSWWFSQMAVSRVTVYPNKLHARRVERDSIASEQPIWNVRHQDFRAWSNERIAFVQGLAGRARGPRHGASSLQAAGGCVMTTLDLAAINLHAGLSALTGLPERIAALTVALAATQERLERVAA